MYSYDNEDFRGNECYLLYKGAAKLALQISLWFDALVFNLSFRQFVCFGQQNFARPLCPILSEEFVF